MVVSRVRELQPGHDLCPLPALLPTAIVSPAHQHIVLSNATTLASGWPLAPHLYKCHM
jgi:hypothetical protein